jgi:sugar phosphate isomerase/epimerase
MVKRFAYLAVIGWMAGGAWAGGVQCGVSAYSFRKATAFEAIEKAQACGAEVIELFLWQTLSPEHPGVTLNQHLGDAHLASLKAKLAACGIRAVNAYAGDFGKTEDETRKLFAFAKRLGLRGLTGEPPAEALDRVERVVKETGVQFCFHNHAKNPDKPQYRNWDPDYLMALMKGRDPRMGFSLDTGHISRSGLDPVAAVRLYGKRTLSVHLKDVKEPVKESIDVPYGQGVGNMAGVLAELRQQGFSGHVAVEYENVTERLLEEVAECLRFIRRH